MTLETVILNKIDTLVNNIAREFRAFAVIDPRKRGVDYGISLEVTHETSENRMILSFCKDGAFYYVTMPAPYVENGVVLIRSNDVVRAVCPFWEEEREIELDYLDIMYRVILSTPNTPPGVLPSKLIKMTPLFRQVILSLNRNTPAPAIYQLQKAINEVVNKMPLHETYMNSMAMNNRLIFCDKVFEGLFSPADKLAYQTTKTKKYHKFGWTSLGLSDGGLADKNYMLKIDLRRLSPFGLRYHNPQRNLYSTLGMKGDEAPIVRSESQERLLQQGISRSGWNWFTAFVDVPDVFEDQILVDMRHANKEIHYTQRIQIFGTPLVKVGQALKCGDVISVGSHETSEIFDTACDSAKVTSVNAVKSNLSGCMMSAYNIVIEYSRKFCNGFKVTNLHGNKGVIRMKELGYAIDPVTGQERKIDVIVGAKTVGKRKNYGQILEAMFNSVLEKDGFQEGTVIADDWSQDLNSIKAGLAQRGFNNDGTWKCSTQFGELKAVCGNVFWGVIKTPHDQLWEKNETSLTNNKGLRRAGLKFSHVEFRSLETMLGENNPVLDEVTSYVQGYKPLNEMLAVLNSMKGVFPAGKQVLSYNMVKPIDQSKSVIIPGHYISGTVVDEFFKPDGFLLKLPFELVTVYDRTENAIEFQGIRSSANDCLINGEIPGQAPKVAGYNYWITDHIYIPEGLLRKCWRHASGMYGMSEIGVLVNSVILALHTFEADRNNDENSSKLQRIMSRYFNDISRMLGSKRGDMSTYGMSIRYPFSAKAVATLNNSLPKNVIEIHRDMATALGVNNGSEVLTERFPCLGFMSMRIQRVHITDNPLSKYVIGVSGNSLVSQNLDFDGDVLFVAAFHTPEAKELLAKEWANPNQSCHKHIKALNERKGAPHIKEFGLEDYNIVPFCDLTIDEHARIIEKNTGVKAQTGPVIALTYNIMRIVENSELAKEQKMKVAVEMFLEKAAQSVFEQKHGGKSLYEIVIDGICTANVEMLTEVGFKRSTTEKLCGLVRNEAMTIGVSNLLAHHQKAIERGSSNIISKIVKKKNRIYFASRSSLNPIALLEAIEQPAVDVPSRMFKRIIAEENTHLTHTEHLVMEKALCAFNSSAFKEAAVIMASVIDEELRGKDDIELIRKVGWRGKCWKTTTI